MNLQQHNNNCLLKTEFFQSTLKEQDNIKNLLKEALENSITQESAREVVNEVLLATQSKITSLIEQVVTLALSTVYGEEYSFELEFQIKRNQNEVIPWIVKSKERFSTREEVGGGVLDIVSLALRLVLWSMTSPRPAPIFILDEPAKFLSRDKQAAFGEMLQQVSDMLKVQIIIVSHSTDIIDSADVAYEVDQTNGVSFIRKLECG